MSPTSRADILRDALRQGDYAEIISELEPQTDLSDEETALLGLALLRSGHFKRAELPLATAMARGDREAAVEYGNLLRVTNQTDRAIRQFEQLLPALEGELRYRALRWYGVSLFTSGHYRSIELIEEARVGYLGLGDQATAARISHTLACLHLRRGEYQRSSSLLLEAIPVLENHPNPRPLLHALHALVDTQLELGFFEEAEQTLGRAEGLAHTLNDPYSQLHIQARRAFLLLKLGDYGSFVSSLHELRQKAQECGEADVYTFASNNLANHLSRIGHHAAALRVLAELTQLHPHRTLETSLVTAMLTLRRGDVPGALGQLAEIRTRAQAAGMRRDATRATLLSALAAHRMNDQALALQLLTESLSEIAGWGSPEVEVALREELAELEELLAFARLQPEMQHVIAAALERATALMGDKSDDLFAGATLLRLHLLGSSPLAFLNDSPLTFRYSYSLPILAYLAMHPQQTRQEITSALWDDENSHRAGANFRKCLTEIRQVCGADFIVMSGPYREPRYALSKKVAVWLDTLRLQQLVEQGDVAAAVGQYKGEFLARLPETEWLFEMRMTTTQGLTKLLRQELAQSRALGDDRRVVLLATTLLDIDPLEVEAEEIRLQAARRVCTPVEIARFEAERYRRMN